MSESRESLYAFLTDIIFLVINITHVIDYSATYFQLYISSYLRKLLLRTEEILFAAKFSLLRETNKFKLRTQIHDVSVIIKV